MNDAVSCYTMMARKRWSFYPGIIVLLICCSSWAAHDFTVLKAGLFQCGDNCRRGSDASTNLLHIEHLGAHPSLIAPPGPDQDYEQWLQALHAYRGSIIHPQVSSQFVLDFKGVRAWLRLDGPLSRQLAFKRGEPLAWRLEARAIEGNNELCLAFDTHDSQGEKLGWTEVLSTVKVPKDGQWHTVTVDVTVPALAAQTVWLRPIFGMDATHNPVHGKMALRNIELKTTHHERRTTIQSAELSSGLDLSLYERSDLKWLATNFVCHFTFMYDLSFYDPQQTEFTIDQFLLDGQREFGGYDALLLWHAYPRIGLDERNQFDFYRDMPGGLEGLRKLVHDIQSHGLKVYINYNPWDRATRREPVSTMQALANIVGEMDVDGIFLDTLAAGSSSFGVMSGVTCNTISALFKCPRSSWTKLR